MTSRQNELSEVRANTLAVDLLTREIRSLRQEIASLREDIQPLKREPRNADAHLLKILRQNTDALNRIAKLLE